MKLRPLRSPRTRRSGHAFPGVDDEMGNIHTTANSSRLCPMLIHDLEGLRGEEQAQELVWHEKIGDNIRGRRSWLG